jgi:hypothetical protein
MERALLGPQLFFGPPKGEPCSRKIGAEERVLGGPISELSVRDIEQTRGKVRGGTPIGIRKRSRCLAPRPYGRVAPGRSRH